MVEMQNDGKEKEEMDKKEVSNGTGFNVLVRQVETPISSMVAVHHRSPRLS